MTMFRAGRRGIAASLGLAALLVLPSVQGAEYFVSRLGDDTNDGLSRSNAFATVQKGVDTLSPGDTLTVAPGEYLESVRRDRLGDADGTTTIRAEIPGTAILRGDVPAPEFRPLQDYRFVHVADFDFASEIPAVNELDTLTVFESKPNPSELEFSPGGFHYDSERGKLFISTSDMEPPGTHRYSVSVVPTHGFYLSNATKVVVEGLGVTGFNALRELNYRERTHGGVWGMFLADGKECVIRDCRAWLNGWGIGLNSSSNASGDNVIERCVAWGNNSAFKSGDMGGLTGFSVRRDIIRDSTAFLNGMYGVNIYGTGTDGGTYGDANVPGNDEANKSRLVNNVAWGNMCDFKIKTGVAYFHTTERCVGPGLWSVRSENTTSSIVGHGGHGAPADSILLAEYPDLDLAEEFADPDNHDYRLQATSRFRASGPDGSDRGPFPYEETVFFAKPDGDDSADGLSVKNAWRTLARATRSLRPGDTLYLEPGNYAGEIALRARADADRPIRLRGRGRMPAVVQGGVRADGVSWIEFERIVFAGPVAVSSGDEVAFTNCSFAGGDTALKASGVNGLNVRHCEFTGFGASGVALDDCQRVDLRSNVFDNRNASAVLADSETGILYSNHNSYADAANAWRVAGRTHSLADLAPRQDWKSVHSAPLVATHDDAPTLENRERFAAAGHFGRNIGTHRDEGAKPEMRLTFGPAIHSVSDTTANIEWMTSLPAGCEVAWGETPACENTSWFDVNYFGTYSLTGLEPGKTYYFTINALRGPSTFRQRIGMNPSPAVVAHLDDRPLSFTTANQASVARTYHVSPEGDDANSGLSRQNAWRTIARAADRVNTGDTVLIAGGEYNETVRIRATGAESAPITFRSAPGEKVVLAGASEKLTAAFLVGGKSHLRFDGFHFRDYNMFSSNPHAPHGWAPMRAAEFNIYRSRDIRLSRCFSDGRGGYSATFLQADEVDDLTVENSVFINKMGGALNLTRCPNARVANNVFARPMIGSFSLYNEGDQKARFHKNIFCGMLLKKARLNASYGEIEDIASLDVKDNAFLLQAFTPDDRIIFKDVDHAVRRVTASYTIPLYDAEFGDTGSIFADPQFAGVAELVKAGESPPNYPPEMLMHPNRDIGFNSFFATNPDLVQRGIGLRPGDFKDFEFR